VVIAVSSHAGPRQVGTPEGGASRAAMAEHRVPGLQIAWLRDGQLAGLEDLGTCDGTRPVLADTVFEGAALGKPLFAYLVLSLARDGVLTMDDRLWDQVPILGTDASGLREVTVAQVLTHSSGLGNGLYLGPGTTLATPPGRSWRYSDAAYYWLQQMVEARTGCALDALAAERVFGPLAMDRSRFSWRGDLREMAASGHDQLGVRQPKWQPSQPIVGTSLHTCARDYACFLIELIRLQRSGDPQEAACAEALFAPRIDATHGVRWSLGFALDDTAGATRAFHWGANPHFRAFAAFDPRGGDGVVMLSNAAGALALAQGLCTRALGGCASLFELPLLHPAY